MTTPPFAGVGLKTVLVIDDDPRLRPVLVEGLEAYGYRTLQAPNTKIGAELARANLPDVIVCDVDMPGQDGKSFLKELRQDPELSDRQFVLMTGDAANANTRTAMELGADDFLLKPFSLGALASAVAARLKRAEISRHLETRMIEQLRTSLHATLPHEFFTPLAGIFGLTEILEEELDDLSKDEIRELTRDILKSARRLHRTLRNYLHIISLDAPNRPASDLLPAAKVAEAFNTGIKTAVDRNRRSADVTAEIIGATLPCGPADCTALAEELVENALSFSAEGSPVKITLKPEKDLLNLEVTDQGRGMTPKQLQQLGLFQQHERKKFEQQGLGLGLALVRRIVFRLGGEFRITSELSKGTTVSITIPLPRAGQAA
ncbi:hybrid sensor histidine kinase/response regulator [Oleiharenicola lentus]|uniref:hybrid sensor histidine kinase/response regulator n=1 Tax=Oleiharenicola lentus TaxID=2508720 RepID=UPI003F6619F7